MEKSKKTFIINVLRRGTYKWHGRWRSEKRSHLPGEKKYFCESCGTICRKKDTQMDHVIPVIDPNRTTEEMSLDEIAERMYPDMDGYQRLCKPCHKAKTQGENINRKAPRKRVRKKKLDK